MLVCASFASSGGPDNGTAGVGTPGMRDYSGANLGSASLATCGMASGCNGVPLGGKVSEQRYLPYGEVRYTWGTLPTDRQYTGQRREATLGFYDYVARQYDPALGRFLQADSIVPNPSDPQSLNRYSYALGNPVRYTDPSGHCAIDDGECLAEAKNIGETFGAQVLDPYDEYWTLETLRWLYQALFQYQIYLGLPGVSHYFGNVGFCVDDAALGSGEYGLWENGTITFAGKAFQEDESNGQLIAGRTNFVHTALHELTHELIADLYQRNIDVVSSFTILGWTQERITETSGWWIFKKTREISVWHGPDDGPTAYARSSNPEEDATETFALLLSGGSFIQDRSVTSTRLGLFAQTIRQAYSLAVQEP